MKTQVRALVTAMHTLDVSEVRSVSERCQLTKNTGN